MKSHSKSPVKDLVPSSLIKGEDEEDTALLRAMADTAEAYIRSFSWCRKVSGAFFGGGVGGIFAVFLFDIEPARADVSRWIWIVVGDIPPAYLPLKDARSPNEVFSLYIQGMMKWVQFARQGTRGTTEDGVPPVSLPATAEAAEDLERRLHLLRLTVKPFFEDQDDARVQ